VNSTVYGEPERPRITYITTLDAGRSDAEIAAENAANQQIKDLREAEEARIEARKRDMYKALGKAAGMDVEKIEAKAEAERAAEAAAAAKRRTDAGGHATESAGQ
jgi:inorganic pyrophosphatase